MKIAKDYGDGFVELEAGTPLMTGWNGVVAGNADAFKGNRCIQDDKGNILLCLEDSKTVLEYMTVDDFWSWLDDGSLATNIMVTVEAQGHLIFVHAPKQPTVGEIQSLMIKVKDFLVNYLPTIKRV